MTADEASRNLRIAFVPGVTLGKWTRAWNERRPDALEVLPTPESGQVSVLHDDVADLSFVRLPVDQAGLHVIPLYSEVPMVVAARDHAIAAADSVTLAELAALDGTPGGRILGAGPIRDDLDLVAAGVGMLLLPQSVARLHARKDVIARPVADAEETRIAVAWLATSEDDRVEEFVGIVRGRTARSSRTAAEQPAEPKAPKGAKGAKDAKDAPGGKGAAGAKGGKGATGAKGAAGGKGAPKRQVAKGGSAQSRQARDRAEANKRKRRGR
jgi:hypothetical protein